MAVTDNFTIRTVCHTLQKKNTDMCQITAKKKDIHYCRTCVGNTTQQRLTLLYVYLNINQLDALNFIMSLFHASTCFEQYVLIVRRSKLYYTASGIITPICVYFMPLHVSSNMCSSSGGQNCIIQPLVSSHQYV